MRIFKMIAVASLAVSAHSVADDGSSVNVLALTGGAGSGAERSSEGRTAALSRGNAGSTQYTIDFVSDGTGTAMDFAIRVDGGARTQVDSTNCVADLPSSHMGQCRYHADRGELKVVVFSMTNAPLHTGPIGSIQVSGAKNVQIVKDSLTVSDSEGNRVSAEVL